MMNPYFLPMCFISMDAGKAVSIVARKSRLIGKVVSRGSNASALPTIADEETMSDALLEYNA